MLKIEKLNDESLEMVSGGQYLCTKAGSAVLASQGAGIGASIGLVFGTINGAKAAKKHTDGKNMSLAEKAKVIVAGTAAGFVGGAVGGAVLGAASGACLGAGCGFSTDIAFNQLESC